MNIPVTNATINVNQIWAAKTKEISLRKIRILAFHPDSGIICEILEDTIIVSSVFEMKRIRESVLIEYFKVIHDVCTHRHTSDIHKSVGEYEPAMPNYYKCDDCGDLFPNTGDTDLWFPKLIES